MQSFFRGDNEYSIDCVNVQDDLSLLLGAC